MTIFNNIHHKPYSKSSSSTSSSSSLLREALTSTVQFKHQRSNQTNFLTLKQQFTRFLSTDQFQLEKSKLNELLNIYPSASLSSHPISTSTPSHIDNIPIKNYRVLNLTWSNANSTGIHEDLPSFILSNDSKSACIHPYCSGCFETYAIRTNQSLKRNCLTYWEISLKDYVCSGTSVMIGIGTKEAILASNGYLNLIGMDKNSWGLSNKGHLWHDNISKSFCDSFDDDKHCGRDIRIGCLYDGYSGRVAYFKDGKLIGVAFMNLPVEIELYPMVSSTVAKSIIKLERAFESFPSLKELARSKCVQNQLPKFL